MADRNDDKNRGRDPREWQGRRDPERREQRAGAWRDEGSEDRWTDREHFGDREREERDRGGWGQERADDWRNRQTSAGNDNRGWRNDRGRDWRSEREHWDRGGQRPEERYGANQEAGGGRHEYGQRDRAWDDRMEREREFRSDQHAGGGERTWSAGHGGATDQGRGFEPRGYNAAPGTYVEQQRRGQFAGRGPKGWKRSDERIREDVSERLYEHPDVDASEVEVSVNEGEVTLSGSVDSREQKRLAEECAWGISGVREVNNHLRVHTGSMLR